MSRSPEGYELSGLLRRCRSFEADALGWTSGYWEEARQHRPENAWVRLCLAETLATSGRAAEAVRELEVSLDHEPIDRAAARLSALIRASRSPAEAVRYFEARVAARRGDPQALWSLGEARAVAGRLDHAMEDLLDAAALDPRESRWYRLDRLLRPLFGPEGLEALWSEASRRFPNGGALKLLAGSAAQPSGRAPLWIDAGGKGLHDREGRHWEADRHFVGGLPDRGRLPRLEGALDPALYASERRTFPGEPDALYAIPVPDGEYMVTVHTRFVAGARPAFQVRIEGEGLSWPEPPSSAPTAMLRRKVSVIDGFVDIDVLSLLDEGCVSAIQVEPIGSEGAKEVAACRCAQVRKVQGERLPASGERTVRIDCGGKEHRDDQGRLWLSDRFFLGGVVKRAALPGVGASAEPIYREYREEEMRTGGFAYAVPLPQGAYLLTLHFLETDAQRKDHRRFSVFLEGRKALADVDTHASWTGRAPRIETLRVEVDDGVLDLELLRTGGNHHQSLPFLSALEIVPEPALPIDPAAATQAHSDPAHPR